MNYRSTAFLKKARKMEIDVTSRQKRKQTKLAKLKYGAAAAGAMMGVAQPFIDSVQQPAMMGKQSRLNVKSAMQMGMFNYYNAMRMWQDTNLGAQVNEAKKAGLSPGLMMSKGGMMAQTAPAQGNPAPGSWPNMKGMDIAGMISVMKAQAEIKALEAKALRDTEEAENARSVDRLNTAANTELTKTNTQLNQIQLEINSETKTDKILAIQAEAGKLQGEMNTAIANGQIAQATVKTQIEQTAANLVSTYLQNQLTQANTKYTKEQTDAIAKNIAIGYINAYANQRSAGAAETNANTNVQSQIEDAAYKSGLLELGDKKLTNDLIMGIGGMLLGKVPQTEVIETFGKSGQLKRGQIKRKE